MTAGSDFAATVSAAVLIFASTNVDDIVLLSVLFADPQLRPRSVVLGQFLGIGVLVGVSAAASVAAVAIPAGWTALLGAVPLGLGLYKLLALLRARGDDEANDAVDVTHAQGWAQVWAVAGVTLANGADNLSVYIPVFAADRSAVPLYAIVFAALTGLWCLLGHRLVNNRVVGDRLRKYGHILLPLVLIALGLHLLSGALVLLHELA